jgi:tetratricopeptide (TPR) repeat protein
MSGAERRREAWSWLGQNAAASSGIQLRVAREARRSGDLLTARAALDRAVASDPHGMEVFIEQIRLHRDALDYGRAEELARAFIRRHPRYPDTHLQLGRIYQVQDRLDEAAGQYEQALRLDADHPTALHRLGEVRMVQGDLEAAAVLLERSAARAPDRYQAHYLLGQVYLRQGKREDAVRELETFRRLKDDLRAHARLSGGAAMEED